MMQQQLKKQRQTQEQQQQPKQTLYQQQQQAGSSSCSSSVCSEMIDKCKRCLRACICVRAIIQRGMLTVRQGMSPTPPGCDNLTDAGATVAAKANTASAAAARRKQQQQQKRLQPKDRQVQEVLASVHLRACNNSTRHAYRETGNVSYSRMRQRDRYRSMRCMLRTQRSSTSP